MSANHADRARSATVRSQADAWRTVSDVPAALGAPDPAVDTYATAGHWSAELDGETTRLLIGAVPAAFHTGIQDILLIAYALAWGEYSRSGDIPIGIDVEGHGRDEGLAADIDLSRTVGWFTAKYPTVLRVGSLDWAQVCAGDAALGGVVKAAKEQLRALPDGLGYGLLRYLDTGAGMSGPDPALGFNYLGRVATGAPAEGADQLWTVSANGPTLSALVGAVPMSLAHSVELNAATVDAGAGPPAPGGRGVPA